MTKKIPQFEDLKILSKDIFTYQSILNLLHWDLETHMPPGGVTARSEQIALLSSHIHDLKTSARYKHHLEKLVSLSSGKYKIKGLSKTQMATIDQWKRDFQRETKLPTSFIKTFSQVTSESSQVWALAKEQKNFKLFAPFLKKIIDLCRQKADMMGFEDHPYDALLETYEPCMTAKKLSTIFDNLKVHLKSLLKNIRDAKQVDDKFLKTKINFDLQRDIGKSILDILPIEKEYSRLDFSSHPFSLALHPQDSRITTRLIADSFMSNIFSILHEAGHSMYEMGLPIDHFGTPICQATTLTIHESQSRFWETLIGRSLPFWQFYYPKLKKILPEKFQKISLEKFYKATNKVTSSCIRVEADEVTYCLHVILRFEIEKRLIEGTLQVEDLPQAWNLLMKDLLDIVPSNDAEGCLQDIHWSLGDFGYFPTYALGNIVAAQLFETFKKQTPTWESEILTGNLELIRNWLKTNIHSHGKIYDTEQLIKKVTGKKLDEEAYCKYLKSKYSKIYRI